MLMRKLPLIRLDGGCINRPSTSSCCSSSWDNNDDNNIDTMTISTTLTSIDDLSSTSSSTSSMMPTAGKSSKIKNSSFSKSSVASRNLPKIIRNNNEYSMTSSSCSSGGNATTNSSTFSSSSASSSSSGAAALKMSITQQGYYSPFEKPKPVNEFVIAPNACAEPMASLASTSIHSISPSRSSFFDRIRDVFRPRSGSKTSVTSIENNQLQQKQTALNGGIIEDLGEQWINILYYEYSEKVGETYQSSATELSITGYCDLSNNYRLNLGSIAKPNRTPIIRHIRSQIRDGVRFYNRNGDVYIDCLTTLPVFVQAPLYAHCNGEHLATVYRLAPDQAMPIFSAAKFDHLIFEAQRRGPEAIAALQQICMCRLSFTKGWGKQYQVQTVLEVPTWIEVLFVGAFRELDLLVHESKQNFRQFQTQEDVQELLSDLSSCPSMSLS